MRAKDKSSSFKADLEKALPSPDGFADVYFDNVGGEILDLMLTRKLRPRETSAHRDSKPFDSAT